MVEDAALPNASCPAGDNVFLWIIAPDSDVGRRRNVEDVAARIFLTVERFADGLDEKLRADDGNIAVVAVTVPVRKAPAVSRPPAFGAFPAAVAPLRRWHALCSSASRMRRGEVVGQRTRR